MLISWLKLTNVKELVVPSISYGIKAKLIIKRANGCTKVCQFIAINISQEKDTLRYT